MGEHIALVTTAVHSRMTDWRDYLALCKLKVVALIVFTAIVGMFLATPGMVPLGALVFGTLGIGLAAEFSGHAAIQQHKYGSQRQHAQQSRLHE